MACGGGSLSDDTSASTSDGGSASDNAARAFAKIQPKLLDSCGGANGVCHVQGIGGAPSWLKAPDAYVSIVAYDNAQTGTKKFITDNQNESRLFTKGTHSGPDLPMSSPLGVDTVAWIKAELAAATIAKSQKVTTAPVTIADGTDVTIDLSKLASGMKGASVTFSVSLIGTILTLSSMKLHAPAANGVRLQHPRFIQVVGTQGTPDPADSCANVDSKVKEGGEVTLGPGTLVLAKWSSTAKLSISFDYAGPYTITEVMFDAGSSGTVQSGCKNVAGYTAIASNFSALSRNCVGCHAGGNAQNALDMSALSRNPPDYDSACASALFQVGLGNKPNSPIILAPTQAGLAHAGGKLTAAETDPYKTAVLQWLAGE